MLRFQRNIFRTLVDKVIGHLLRLHRIWLRLLRIWVRLRRFWVRLRRIYLKLHRIWLGLHRLRGQVTPLSCCVTCLSDTYVSTYGEAICMHERQRIEYAERARNPSLYTGTVSYSKCVVLQMSTIACIILMYYS